MTYQEAMKKMRVTSREYFRDYPSADRPVLEARCGIDIYEALAAIYLRGSGPLLFFGMMCYRDEGIEPDEVVPVRRDKESIKAPDWLEGLTRGQAEQLVWIAANQELRNAVDEGGIYASRSQFRKNLRRAYDLGRDAGTEKLNMLLQGRYT